MQKYTFILDVDGDTTLTADTDDEIDIRVGGTDRSTIKATGFHNVDNVKFVAGAGDDLEIYHDGTNSLIANKTGALKVATETSGIALTIGHTTSQVTIADNLTVVGNLTVTGTETIQNTVTMNAQNAIIFEGATADNYETTLTVVDPTADRTITIPNETGTLITSASAATNAFSIALAAALG